MPSRLRKQKDARRAAYIANSDKVRAQRSLNYNRDLEKERARAREYSQASYNALSRVNWAERKAQMLALSKEAYAASPTKKRAQCRASSKAAYDASPTKKRAQMRGYSKNAYAASPTKKRASSKAAYDASPTKKRAQMRGYSKKAYAASPTKSKRAQFAAFSKATYDSSPTKKRVLMRAYSKKAHAAWSGAQLKAQRARCRKYYTKNAAAIRASMRARRALAEPKADVVAMYVTSVEHRQPALQKRKDFGGCLIKTTRVINGFTLKGEEDFGDCGHCVSSEPYFYDTAYHLVMRDLSIPVDQSGKCVVAEEILSKNSKPGVQTEASKGSEHEASQVPKPTI